MLAEALELTPFGKMLYSSDAFGLPELHYLGAIGFRRDLARVTGEFVADGAWTAADADRVAGLIGSGNANRVYRLDRVDRRTRRDQHRRSRWPSSPLSCARGVAAELAGRRGAPARAARRRRAVGRGAPDRGPGRRRPGRRRTRRRSPGPAGSIRIGRPDGPSIALRAELDALPIAEQTGVRVGSTDRGDARLRS